MIPLMMQKNYQPKGWRKSQCRMLRSLKCHHDIGLRSNCVVVVGLIMGTRMWYAFFDAEKDDHAAFEHRLEGVVREIGERGKLMVPESTPPLRSPPTAPAAAPLPTRTTAATPTPTRAPVTSQSKLSPGLFEAAPSPVPAPAPVPLSAVATPQLAPSAVAVKRNFATQVSQAPESVQRSSQYDRGSGTSLQAPSMEVSAFMTEQLNAQAREEKLWQEVQSERQEAKAERQEAKAERQVLEAKIDRLREEMVEARVRSEMQAKVEAAETKLRDQRGLESQLRQHQLATLQARLETLYTAKLLADDDLYAVEDAIADSEEGAEDDRVPALLVLSSKMASDRAFARQLQRKKWF